MELRSQLPSDLLRALGVKGLIHLSTGNLVTVNAWPGMGDGVRQLLQAARVTTGIGVAIPSPMGEIGLTLSHCLSGLT